MHKPQKKNNNNINSSENAASPGSAVSILTRIKAGQQKSRCSIRGHRNRFFGSPKRSD